MKNKELSNKGKLKILSSIKWNHILLIVVTPIIMCQFALFLKTGSIYQLFLTLLSICSNITLFIPEKILNNSKINKKKLLLMQIISALVILGIALAVFFI